VGFQQAEEQASAAELKRLAAEQEADVKARRQHARVALRGGPQRAWSNISPRDPAERPGFTRSVFSSRIANIGAMLDFTNTAPCWL